MAAEKLAPRISAMSNLNDQKELRPVLESMINGIRAVLAILDADAGVTATNTVATFDAAITKT